HAWCIGLYVPACPRGWSKERTSVGLAETAIHRHQRGNGGRLPCSRGSDDRRLPLPSQAWPPSRLLRHPGRRPHLPAHFRLGSSTSTSPVRSIWTASATWFAGVPSMPEKTSAAPS